jgi:hypothetical protein
MDRRRDRREDRQFVCGIVGKDYLLSFRYITNGRVGVYEEAGDVR